MSAVVAALRLSGGEGWGFMILDMLCWIGDEEE